MKNINNQQPSDTSWEGWDDQEVWKNINEALNKKEKRMLLPWFIFLGFGAILFAIVYKKDSAPQTPKANVSISTAFLIPEERVNSNAVTDEDCPPDMTQKSSIVASVIASNVYNPMPADVDAAKARVITSFAPADTTLSATVQPLQTPRDLVQNASADQAEWVTIMPISSVSRLMLSSIIERTDTLNPSLALNPFTIPEIINHKNDRSGFALFFDHGIGTGHRQDDVDNNVPWQKLKVERERFLYSNMHKLYAVKTFKNGLAIATGLSWSRHISNLNGTNQTLSIQSFDSDSARVQLIDGLNYYHSGQLTKTVTKSEVFDVYNTHSILSIPIEVGYSFSMRNSLIMLSVGTQFTVGQELKGYTFDENSEIVAYDQLSQVSVMRSLGFNDWISSVNYIRPLTKSIGINLGLNIVMPLQSSIQFADVQSNVFQSRQTSYFLKMGLVYRIK